MQEDARFTDAREHYAAAARLQSNSALAQLNLGGLHEELGELSEAEACFRAALRIQPDFALPHALLATLLRGRRRTTGSSARGR